MNNPFYETFIRICQGSLININGTQPPFLKPFFLLFLSPVFFFILLLLQSPFTASPSSMVQLGSLYLSFFRFPPSPPLTLTISPILTSNTDAVPMMSGSYLPSSSSSPLSSPGPVQHLHPPPSGPSCYPFPSLPFLPLSPSSLLPCLLTPSFLSPHLHVLQFFSLCLFMQISPPALWTPHCRKLCGPAPFISVRLY